LDEAAADGDNIVAAGAEEAPAGARSDGKDALVAVGKAAARAEDRSDIALQAAQAAQGVVHPLQLEAQLLVVVHMHQAAAAAAAVVRAGRLDAVGGGGQAAQTLAVDGGGARLDDKQLPLLALHGAGDEYGPVSDAADAVALAGVAGDEGGVDAVFDKLTHILTSHWNTEPILA